MKKVSLPELVKKAEEIDKKGIKWHHHYLPPECNLSERVNNKHVIILENHNSKETWFAENDDKRLDELEKLENLFFKRGK